MKMKDMKYIEKNKKIYNIILEMLIIMLIVISVFLVSEYIIGYFTNNNLVLDNNIITRFRRIGKKSIFANIFYLFLFYFSIKFIIDIFRKDKSNYSLSYIIFIIPYYIITISYNITLSNIGRSWNIEDIKMLRTGLIALSGRKGFIDKNIIIGSLIYILIFFVLKYIDYKIDKNKIIITLDNDTKNINFNKFKFIFIIVLLIFSKKVYDDFIFDDSFIEDIVYTRGAIGTLLYRYKNRINSINNYTKEDVIKVYNKYKDLGDVSSNVDVGSFKDKNVIIVVEESMSQMYEESFDYMNLPIIKNLNNSYKGNLYIYNRYGFTAYSEREFLTGFNFNTSYYADAYDYNDSIIKDFNDMGYYTTSIHFCTPEVYRYGEFYKNIGFDKMYFKDDGKYEYPVSWLPLNDKDTFNNLLSIMSNNKKEHEKNLYYVVTTSAHDIDNAHYYNEYNPNLKFDNLDDESIKEINNYFTFMKKNNDDLEYLFKELKKLDEEYLVLVFGDHPYKFKNIFKNKIIKDYNIYKEYLTPFVFWSNKDDVKSRKEDYYMIPYLYVDLLDYVGANNTVFLKFLKHMREYILSINDIGIYSKRAGDFIKYDEMDNKEKELINDLKIINFAYFNKEYSSMFFK